MLNIGQVIRRRRVELNLSQEELADRANLHRNYIGAVERGERNVTLVSLHRIASAFGVLPSAILQEAESLTKQQRKSTQ